VVLQSHIGQRDGLGSGHAAREDGAKKQGGPSQGGEEMHLPEIGRSCGGNRRLQIVTI
jgi:hypothetical protein